MKRWGISALIVLLFIFFALSRTAIDPSDITGHWYSSQEQCIYLFQEGFIYSQKYPVPLSEDAYISGAYAFSGKSVFLFTKGIGGLETEREVFLVETKEECLLCENQDGSGQIYFVRDNREKQNHR